MYDATVAFSQSEPTPYGGLFNANNDAKTVAFPYKQLVGFNFWQPFIEL